MSRMHRKRLNGQSTTEYGVVIALIAVIAIAALASASVAVGGAFGFINQRVQAVIPAPSGSGSAPTAIVDPSSNLIIGQSVMVTGTGFSPNSSVTMTLHSTPFTLGTTVADSSGDVAAVVSLPYTVDTSISHVVSLASSGTQATTNQLTMSQPQVVPVGLSSATVAAMTLCPEGTDASQCTPITVTDTAGTQAGQFAWLSWGSGVVSLAAAVGPPANSDGFPTSVTTSTAVNLSSDNLASPGLTSALSYYLGHSVPVYMPVYAGCVTGSGASASVDVVATVLAQITSASSANSSLQIVLRSLNGYAPSLSPTPAPSPTAAPTATPTPAPTAAFVLPTISLKTLFTVTSSSTGSITGYDWNWGDGTAHGTTASTSHTYNSHGTYTITLTVSGPGGQSAVSHGATV